MPETPPWGCGWPRPVIHIDPAVSFGRPMIRGVACEVLAERVLAGEDVETVAADYGVTRAEVLLACWWVGTNGLGRLHHRWCDWAETVHQALAHGAYEKIGDPPNRSDHA